MPEIETIKLLPNGLKVDTIQFYLADLETDVKYRVELNDQWYIIERVEDDLIQIREEVRI